jgi:hypothetical protein
MGISMSKEEKEYHEYMKGTIPTKLKSQPKKQIKLTKEQRSAQFKDFLDNVKQQSKIREPIPKSNIIGSISESKKIEPTPNFKLPELIKKEEQTWDCEYLVLQTNYTARIVERLDELKDELKNQEIRVKIEFIYDGLNGGLYNISGNELGESKSEDRNLPKINHVLKHTLEDPVYGIIVFSRCQVTQNKDNGHFIIDMSTCFEIQRILEEFQYCKIFGINSVQYITHKDGDIFVISSDSESG